MNIIQQITVWALPVLFAITFHEVAHGWVALRFGDDTALREGRLTLNPLNHIDIVGTIVVPVILLLIGGIVFGWAKPVPVNWSNLKNPRRDMALVAFAGPMANLLMAIFWALVLKLALIPQIPFESAAIALVLMGKVGVLINLLLMIFNLLPIPPLDGSKVLSSFLPGAVAYQLEKLEPFGFFILLALIASGALRSVIGVPVLTLQHFIFNLLGI